MARTAADFLREHRDEIVRAWEGGITKQAADVRLAGAALRDHLPALLGELASWLERGEAAGTAPLRTIAGLHASERLDSAYGLSQLIREFRVLRETILRLLLQGAPAERAGTGTGTSRAADRALELARLNAALDVAIADVVEQFVAERDRRTAEYARFERRYTELFDNSPDALFVSRGGQVVLVNRACAELFGARAAAELIGKSLFELFHPDDHAIIRARLAEVMGGPMAAVREERIVRLDGTVRDVEVGAAAFPDVDETAVQVILRDVTDRKRTERTLRESESRFRALADGSPVPIWVTDREGRNEFVNRAYCEFFGVSPERVHGTGWIALLHPDDAAGYVGALREALRRATPFRARGRVRRADGAWRWIESYGAPRAGAGGEVLGMAGSSPDVTELTEADEAVRASEARLRRTLRNASAGAWEWRPGEDGFVWSEENYALFGVSPGTTLVQSAWESAIHPEDLPGVRAATAAALDGRAREYRHEFRVRVGGETRWLLGVGQVEGGQGGEPLVFRGMNLDVTERKRAEEAVREQERRYRSLFESTADAVYLTCHDGQILDANRAACELHQMSVEEIRARGRAGLVVEDERLADGLAQRRATGRARAELRMRRKDGSTVPVEADSVIVDPGGSEFTSFVIARDITDRKRAEEALRTADQRRVEFLGVLSHELRNPLAPIRNSIYLLEHAPAASEQAARAKAVLRRQTEHLTRLVDDLLDVTRISRGKIQLRRQPLDLGELARRTADDQRTVFGAAGVGLRVELATPDPVWIDADATRIAQVLGNLLHNAAKFTPSGGSVVVEVRADGDFAVLSVKDCGVGMEPQTLARLFEPFSQADRTLARAQGGLGLGLALVRGLVELHGGAVEARSAGVGHGAEFLARLPRLRIVPGAEAPRPGAPGAARRRILVIEDNHDAGRSLADILELGGHEVRVARDGRSGIELARELRPDIVLCDIGLPDVDGYEVARTLRREEALRATHLVALSGYAQPQDRARGRAAGFDAHLAKPPNVDELQRLLGAIPAGKASKDALG